MRQDSGASNVMFESFHRSRGSKLSRRDDIESLIYVLLYLLNNGILPWTSTIKRKNLSLEQKKMFRSSIGMISITKAMLPALIS